MQRMVGVPGLPRFDIDVSTRSRIVWFGSCGLLVLAGIACAVAFPGETGQILALVLIGLGLVLATALVFLEIGLSEDRDRAAEASAARDRDERRREPAASADHVSPAPEAGRAPRRRRLERMRGRPRRPG
jgi:hypothetical protein